jgi:phage replication-related protein YjqB (UPF0714/DUF867 family)
MSDTFPVSVLRASASQRDLIEHREHCSMDPLLVAGLDLDVGDQVRVVRSDDDYGLYTVSESGPEQPHDVVRMGRAGRNRLGTIDEFAAVVDRRVPNPTMTDARAEAAGEFVERLSDDGRNTGLIAIAPHGGDIECHTDEQAERVAATLAAHAVSAWRCKGWKDSGALRAWHITASNISPRSFPLLGSVMSRRFAHAVAFHGFDDPEILIGGTAPLTLKRTIREEIKGATAGSHIRVRIARRTDRFGGDDPMNIVNRLTRGGIGGIQIEQSGPARDGWWAAIADAVARVYADVFGCPTSGF